MARRTEPRILMLPVEKIRPHESYDRGILRQVAGSIASEGILHDPVIADSGSFMILDGTHRFWALASMGCLSIPVALYDYLSNGIRIGCWYRCVSPADERFPGCAFRPDRASRRSALSMVSSRRAHLAVICKDAAHLVRAKHFDIFEAYNILSEVEGAQRSRGSSVVYATEGDALEAIDSGDAAMVVAPPPILKEEAIYAATTGRLFPIKSTRHMLPSRPIGIDVPMEWLAREPASADALLQAKLSSGRFRRAKAGSVIKGRRYEEEVYIYRPQNS